MQTGAFHANEARGRQQLGKRKRSAKMWEKPRRRSPIEIQREHSGCVFSVAHRKHFGILARRETNSEQF
jgi:hypothetical protein